MTLWITFDLKAEATQQHSNNGFELLGMQRAFIIIMTVKRGCEFKLMFMLSMATLTNPSPVRSTWMKPRSMQLLQQNLYIFAVTYFFCDKAN